MDKTSILMLSVVALPILVAITFHEAAHAYAAWRLGDDTAMRLGRVSFNPIRHIHPIGTVALPLFLFLTNSPFLFGFAKPVPVSFGRLNNIRRDTCIVALAGPGANIALALVSALLLNIIVILPSFFATWAHGVLFVSVQLNCVLAIFNMLPIPPLDGGRVMTSLLPAPLAARYAGLERYGIFIVLGLILVVPMIARQLRLDFNPLSVLVWGPAESMTETFIELFRFSY